MSKVDSLPLDTVDKVIEAGKIYGNIVNKITERMDYIIRHCVIAAGRVFDWWDWLGDGDWDDQSSGEFMYSYNKDSISIRATWSGNSPIIFIDKNGDEWDLTDGIPTRWLTEDFEEEFANGLNLYKEKEAQKKQKAKEKTKQREAEAKELKKSAAAKLTKEERKALGI